MNLKILFIILFLPFVTFAQDNFNRFFENKSMRFDFLLGGNQNEVTVFPQQIKQEPHWAGSTTKLVDRFNYGSYRFRVFDLKSNQLIFSKGFSTLFQEWQTTPEAKTMNRTFYQAAIFPYPKNNIRLEIDARQWNGNFQTIYSTEILPDNYFVLKELPLTFDTTQIVQNGNPHNMVDVVILAEGYTANEMDKFVADAHRISRYLFNEEPFKTEQSHFNVTAIHTPSIESGTDIPGEGTYKNTLFNSSFYTFDVSRYLTTSDMKTIYDAAAAVPYDHIYILVNSERYGGGGFYNFLSVCTADNALTKEVFVHEFGHGFAGLGDEYYTSDVAYEDFYNLKVEPWEPNITTLVNFESKWKAMVADTVPVPTPRKSAYNKTVGVYEGGGYTSKGIYSPHMDCRMKSNEAGEFCPVCREAIKQTIQSFVE